jgi:hypothetical protein
MALLGLKDDYVHDGRVLFEVLNPAVLPKSLAAQYGTLLQLARVYKQINAPFGQLATDSLSISTAALVSNSDGDATYNNLEGKISDWTTRRNGIATQMRAMLEAAAFSGKAINNTQAQQLIQQGQALQNEVSACAANVGACGQ